MIPAAGDATVFQHVPNRRQLRNPIGKSVRAFKAKSANASPKTQVNLKPCPESPAANADLRMLRMRIDDEVLIGRHRVKTNVVMQHWPTHPGHQHGKK